MTNEPSPRPWRVNSVTGGHISDANGDPVCFCIGRNCGERAALIVDAVNALDAVHALSIKLYDPLRKAEAERDRLRDLVKRMAHLIGETPIDWFGESFVETQVLLNEARAALGEDKP